MKTKNSIKNSFASIIGNTVTILIGLISQKVFVEILGKDYLGLNGLFTNIISMLAIVELGIGSAIIYNLYKPIENDDKKTIKSLMNFYKKAYNIIAIIVLFIGLFLTPFLNFFIKKVTVNINIEFVYILFIIDIVCSYLLSYKRSILYADQKNYIITAVHMAYLIILNVFQLIILFLTKNYYLYLIIKIIMRILENVVIHVIVNKKYDYLREKNVEKLPKEIEKDIFKKIKALFYHKIGTFIVLGTDNLIISKYFGLGVVGLYSNYYLIIDALNKLFGQAISALTPSVGHMLVTDSKEKIYSVFKKVRFINFWIATFAGTGLLVVIQPFIKIWLGENYLLSNFVLIVLVINFYQKMMRNSYSTFKEAAGIYHEDRYIPLFESFLNIFCSIIFLHIFGLAGVFIGTIISGLTLWCYSYPKFIYKNIFGRNYFDYFKETFGYILLFYIISSVSYFVSSFINYTQIINLILCIITVIIIPNLIIIIVFNKSENFIYYKNLLITILNKLRKK